MYEQKTLPSWPSSERFVEITQTANVEPPARGEIIRSNDVKFLEEARRFRSRDDEQCEFAPFKEYWPTYENLNERQQGWYFYWRSEARLGNYLPTDTSYLFLHAYEILNLIEKPDPIEAAAYLKALWRRYRQDCKEINTYFPDWSGDLIAEFIGTGMALDWWEEMLNEALLPAPVLNSLIQRGSYDNTLADLPMELWLRLTDFRPDNKFCELHNGDGKVTETHHRAVAIADMYWRAKTGNSIVEQFVSGNLSLMKKELFTSALIGREHKSVCLEAAREYVGNPVLSCHLSSVMKHAENVLREQAGFRHRLTAIELTDELKTIIKDILLYGQTPPAAAKSESMLDRPKINCIEEEGGEPSSQLFDQIELPVLPSSVIEKPVAARLEVTSVLVITKEVVQTKLPAISQKLRLDRALIEKLHRESDEISQLLGEATDEPNDWEIASALVEAPIEKEASSVVCRDEWQQLLSSLTAAEKVLVKMLVVTGKLCEKQVENLAREQRLMPATFTDGLNDKTIEVFERPLLISEDGYWVLYDEEDMDRLKSRLS